MKISNNFLLVLAAVFICSSGVTMAQEFKIETGDEKKESGDDKVVSKKKTSEKDARIVVTGTRTKNSTVRRR